ncbi:response regulator [Daejeonella sp.]|uniref:response regulator transcription factor n=1 Tax=Daejeonella sp. TaxID=2805397 RepID=UPI0030BD8517
MKRVLVVDDNEDILNVISIVLDMEGFEVKCCDSGRGIADTISAFAPDVILLDIMLGDLDGRDVCRALKSDPKSGHIPVIMISASHNLFDRDDKLDLADDFIAKPFDIDDLASKVHRHIKREGKSA